MSKVLYKIKGWGLNPIEEVEVVSETKHFATIVSMRSGRKIESREKKEGSLFQSFEEARAYMQAKYEREASAYRQRMNDALSRAGEFRAMKNPYAARTNGGGDE